MKRRAAITYSVETLGELFPLLKSDTDARIYSMHWDQLRQTLQIMVTSDKFEEVPEGAEARERNISILLTRDQVERVAAVQREVMNEIHESGDWQVFNGR